jgi:hypothetical protein
MDDGAALSSEVSYPRLTGIFFGDDFTALQPKQHQDFGAAGGI